jgi:two-component system NarL family sensor kinase
MHKQEEVAFAVILGTIVFFFLCLCLLMFFIVLQNNKKRHVNEQKRIRLNYENELANVTLEIHEAILSHISKEMHDNVGQLLTVGRIHLNTMCRFPNKITKEKIEETFSVVDMALHELRLLSKTFSPENIQSIDITDALQLEIARINKLEIIKTELHVTGKVSELHSETKTIVFRIIQEFIANTIKHANASEIRILLNYSVEKLTVDISDNGCGFHMEDKILEGSGISNILIRCKLIGDHYKFKSEPNGGTHLMFDAPFNSVS